MHKWRQRLEGYLVSGTLGTLASAIIAGKRPKLAGMNDLLDLVVTILFVGAVIYHGLYLYYQMKKS